MNTEVRETILLLDPESPWGNKYDPLFDALKEAGFDVFIFHLWECKHKYQYDELIDECIEYLDLCEAVLKPRDEIVDFWLADIFYKTNTGLKRIIKHAETTGKPVITFKADWRDWDGPAFSYIYFNDDAGRVVKELQKGLAALRQ